VNQLEEGQEGFQYVASGGFPALRRERNRFSWAVSVGTGPYRLGDTWWITAGLQRKPGPLHVQMSFSQGVPDACPDALVEKPEARPGAVQTSRPPAECASVGVLVAPLP